MQYENQEYWSLTLRLHPMLCRQCHKCLFHGDFSSTRMNIFLLHTHSKIVKIAEHVRKQEFISKSLPVKRWWASWLAAILISKTSTDTAHSLHSMRLLWKAQVSWRMLTILLNIPPWMVLLFLIPDNGLQDPENMFPAFSLVVNVADNDYLLL